MSETTDPPSSSEEVSALSFYRIDYFNGIVGSDGGNFCHQQDRVSGWTSTWIHSRIKTLRPNQEEDTVYEEFGANPEAVFLKDPSENPPRDVAIRLDLRKGKVFYIDPATSQEIVKGRIVGTYAPPKSAEYRAKRANISRVEFKYPGREGGGYFIQIDAVSWAEQHWGESVTHSFQEYGRGEEWVFLKDYSRNVSIRLDLANQKVLYSLASESPRALYQIFETSPGPPRGVFWYAKRFNDWCASDGPNRIGLPAASMWALDRLARDFRGRSAHIFYDMDEVKRLWMEIEATQVLGRMTPLTQRLTAYLARMRECYDALVKQAMQCRILMAQSGGANDVLRERIPYLERAARVLLQGSEDTIGEGGVPLTPAQWYEKQEKKATDVAEAKTTLQDLANLDSELTAYQNYLSQAEAAFGEALHDADKAQFTASEHIGQYYSRKAGKEIRALVAWTDTFSSAISTRPPEISTHTTGYPT